MCESSGKTKLKLCILRPLFFLKNNFLLRTQASDFSEIKNTKEQAEPQCV